MLDQSGAQNITVACKLRSDMWQITIVACPTDIHGAYRLPLHIPIVAYDADGPRRTNVEFFKGNKRGKWFYKEV